MTNYKKIIQIMLIMLGIFLILATYFYSPISQKRKSDQVNLKNQESFVKEEEFKDKDKDKELNFEEKVELFVENLEVDKNLGQRLVNEGFSSIEEIYQSGLEKVKKIEEVDEKLAKKMMEKSKVYIANKKEKINNKIEDNKAVTAEDEIINLVEGEDANIFENVEYSGIYNANNTFILKSDTAKIFTASPNFVVMKNMHVTLYMDDGRVVVITSDSGTYNKVTYDSFFEKNVKATDGETIILGDNLDLISTEKWAQVYNNVIVKDQSKSFLRADKIHYDFTSELYQVSMFDKGKVKVKLIK